MLKANGKTVPEQFVRGGWPKASLNDFWETGAYYYNTTQEAYDGVPENFAGPFVLLVFEAGEGSTIFAVQMVVTFSGKMWFRTKVLEDTSSWNNVR